MTQADRSFVEFSMTEVRAKPLSPIPTAPRLGLSGDASATLIPMRGADVSEILRCVCQSYFVSPSELTGPRKHKNIGEARLVAYWLLRTVGDLSYPEIGLALHRDHTSAMSGVRRCERRRAAEPSFKAFLNDLAAAVMARLKGEGAV